MAEFTETDTSSAVYRASGFDPIREKIHLPAKAKSRFAEERDVQYGCCYATVVADEYVIVGEVPSDG